MYTSRENYIRDIAILNVKRIVIVKYQVYVILEFYIFIYYCALPLHKLHNGLNDLYLYKLSSHLLFRLYIYYIYIYIYYIWSILYLTSFILSHLAPPSVRLKAPPSVALITPFFLVDSENLPDRIATWRSKTSRTTITVPEHSETSESL